MAKSVRSAEDGEKLQNAVVGQEWKPLPYLLSITNLLLHDIEAPNIANCDSLGTNITDFKESDKVDVIGMNPPYGGSTEDSIKSRIFSASSICILSSVCRVLYFLHIPLLQPTYSSLIMRLPMVAKKDSKPKKHGSTALICRKATSTSPRPNQ